MGGAWRAAVVAWGLVTACGEGAADPPRRVEGGEDPGGSAPPADWEVSGAAARPWSGLQGPSGPPGAGSDTGESPIPGEPLAVCINELMPANRVAHRDPSGAASDWIELHNPTAQDLPLDGWSMTDDPSEPRKHVLGGGLTLPAGGFLVLWADDAPGLGPDHLGFALAEGGEAVGLYAPDGTGSVVWFGPMPDDLAVGRITDCCREPAGGCLQIGFGGTPGATNAP